MDNVSVVQKFRMWAPWRDEQHEQWLQRMAAEGLHLRRMTGIGIHTFERGAPQEVVYRWDVRDQRDADYMQLFRDAGWEHVVSLLSWHCWRKARQAGQMMEIFSDTADKVRKYRRMLVPMSLIAVLQLSQFSQNPTYWATMLGQNSKSPLMAAFLWVGLGTMLACLYGSVMLALRIRALKRA